MSIPGNWRVLCRYNIFNDGHDVAVVFERPDGTRSMARPLVMGPEEPHLQAVPLLEGKEGTDFLRAALNAAWEAGLRPDGFDDTRESMKATNAHLQDMRAIAFHKLGTPKP